MENQEKSFIISEDQANTVLRYLASRPYAEVVQLCSIFHMLEEAPKPCECPEVTIEDTE